jgi:hypothetical protein
MSFVGKAVVVSIAALELLAAAERPARAQEKSQFALCLQTGGGTQYYFNFVTQGNAILLTGRQGIAGFPDNVGVISGSMMTSSLNHGFPVPPSQPVMNFDLAFTSLIANSPTDVTSPGEMDVFTFPLPFTGTGFYRRTIIPGDASNPTVTKGTVQVCTHP